MLIENNINGNNTQSCSTVSVRVSAWRLGAKNGNHSIPAILKNQGFSNKEIYKENEGGATLLEIVAELNNLRYPNLVKAGETLLVPSKVV